jgi:hypothetical protein
MRELRAFLDVDSLRDTLQMGHAQELECFAATRRTPRFDPQAQNHAQP